MSDVPLLVTSTQRQQVALRDAYLGCLNTVPQACTATPGDYTASWLP